MRFRATPRRKIIENGEGPRACESQTEHGRFSRSQIPGLDGFGHGR